MTIRYFSLGRFAMREAFSLIGVGEGDFVMMPSYICRDVLASVHERGAKPIFYDVDSNLQPKFLDPKTKSKAIIAVNYFGFPQNLEAFENYARSCGAVIVEDNAHGLLSRDENGNFLGQRTDFGITSFRKTIRTPDGAILRTSLAETQVSDQLDYVFRLKNGRNVILRFFAAIQRVTNFPLLNWVQSGMKRVRRGVTGSAIPSIDETVERIIPGIPNPSRSSVRKLLNLNEAEEISRRRDLYNAIYPEIIRLGIKPVFESLKNGTCPYGFPVFATADSESKLSDLARKYRVTLMSWPDLPLEVLPTAPNHYKQIWLLNFL
jgi:hypothetical protein